jgi:hypothetical protein
VAQGRTPRSPDVPVPIPASSLSGDGDGRPMDPRFADILQMIVCLRDGKEAAEQLKATYPTRRGHVGEERRAGHHRDRDG